MSPPLRPLPIAFGPLHRETIGSYLNRLADANRLHIITLSTLLLGRSWPCRHDDSHCRHWKPDTFGRLAELTRRSRTALTYALPGIQPDGNQKPWNLPPDGRPRPVCRSCAARHGWHGMAIRRSHSHEDRCTRHHRWIGRTREYDLDLLPWTHSAHQHHHQLARRFGPSTVDRAYLNTMRDNVRQFGRDRSATQIRWESRLDTLGQDPYGDPLRPSSERLELITYPEAIAQMAHILNRWPPAPENANKTEKLPPAVLSQSVASQLTDQHQRHDQ